MIVPTESVSFARLHNSVTGVTHFMLRATANNYFIGKCGVLLPEKQLAEGLGASWCQVCRLAEKKEIGE